MFQSLIVPFLTICLAELGDKSQLSILLLASKVKNHLHLLLGVLIAFAIVDGSAILLGAWITSVIPGQMLSFISGIVFVIFGVFALLEKHEEGKLKTSVRGAFISGFSMVFFAEWGDKTQIASALFAAKNNPLLVFIAVMLAQALLAISAIFVGKVLLKKVDKKIVSRVSGILFVLIGIYTIFFSR